MRLDSALVPLLVRADTLDRSVRGRILKHCLWTTSGAIYHILAGQSSIDGCSILDEPSHREPGIL